MTTVKWQAELDFAIEAAKSAGDLTLRWFQAGPKVEHKSDRSPVTIADRDAERELRTLIRSQYPDDSILGEEDGEELGRSGRRWVLDPIDGTRSFIHGVPLYGVMVALEDDGVPVLGVLHFPALGETVAAARGLGCHWNGQPARVSEVDEIDQALVLTSGDVLAAESPALQRLTERAGMVRTWGDCYGYALVATGRAEAMLDPVLKVWDAAAIQPIIEEAGGVFSDWNGRASHITGNAVATNQKLARAIRGEL